MTVRSAVRAWNEFFFEPQPPTPLALFRILYGLLVMADLILLRPDWLTWFGPHAFVSLETLRKMEPGTRINLFVLIPQSDAWINGFFWLFLFFAALLTVGLFSRVSSVVVFLCLTSMSQRGIYILHSGDSLLRVTGFFLMFAPTGAALSVDRLLRIWRGKEGAAVPLRRPWAQRMIQIQSALAYLGTFYWKTLGKTWLDGTALYYSSRLEEFRRFPMPSLENPLILKLASWSTLLIEFAAGVLVWFRDLRYIVLLLGLCLHLSIEYSMNIPLFQWVIISTYVTFIYPEDLARAWAWVRRRVTGGARPSVFVVYDGASAALANRANVLRAIDVFGRLRVLDLRSAEARSECPEITLSEAENRILFETPAGVLEGFDGLRHIARLVPLLWPLAPFSPRARQAKLPLRAASAPK